MKPATRPGSNGKPGFACLEQNQGRGSGYAEPDERKALAVEINELIQADAPGSQ
jgi:hypothetical protein